MNKNTIVLCIIITVMLSLFSACGENGIKQTGIIYDDAYSLIEEDFVHWGEFSEGTSTYTSAWDYDNRNRVGHIGNQAGLIYDYSEDYQVVLHRAIQKQESGLLGFRMEGNITNGNGKDLFFRLTDETDNDLLSLHIKNNEWYFGDTATGINAPDGFFKFFVEADLDKNIAAFYLNSTKIGQYDINDCAVTDFSFGSTKENIGTIIPTNCELYMNYFINESFRFNPGEELFGWDKTGEVVLETKAQTTTAKLNGGAEIVKSFDPVSGEIIFETYMLLPEDEDCGYVTLKSGESDIATIKVEKDGIYNSNGDKLRWRTSNLWYILRIEANTKKQTVKYKINGKTVLENEAFKVGTGEITGVKIGCSSGNIYTDDIKVFNKAEHADYCPKPIKTEDDYTVIINSCNLWREGHHVGWSCVSPFEENIPVLGFYDEGIPEEADWEIKMLVENGVDVIHLCWYAPDNVTEPIKRPSHNYFLQDGFMNAEYSDMMKFTFMYENLNGSGNVKTFEQFKEYIWKYWVEYYFTDPRFYTIDNRIVFTTFVGFEEFLNVYTLAELDADLEQYGFDGVELIQRYGCQVMTEHTNTRYIYGYGSNDYTAEIIIDKLKNHLKHPFNINNGKYSSYTIPMAGNGFNNIAWADTRFPLMTTEDFEKVLTFIRDDYLPGQFYGWRQKTVMLGCFNEYGEGHYLMPSNGHVGFGYLEAVKKVFSDSDDFSMNIRPTEAQKARICHMFPQNRTELRALRKEDNNNEATPRYLIIDDVVCGTSVYPYIEGDEFYVAAEPMKGFFSLNNFYYTWSRHSGTLDILTRDDVEIRFTVGSDIATVNGEERKLAKAIELYDGLPVLPMNFLYSVAGQGYSCSCDGTTMTAYTGAKQQ